jgi:hypothetical protein
MRRKHFLREQSVSTGFFAHSFACAKQIYVVAGAVASNKQHSLWGIFDKENDSEPNKTNHAPDSRKIHNSPLLRRTDTTATKAQRTSRSFYASAVKGNSPVSVSVVVER